MEVKNHLIKNKIYFSQLKQFHYKRNLLNLVYMFLGYNTFSKRKVDFFNYLYWFIQLVLVSVVIFFWGYHLENTTWVYWVPLGVSFLVGGLSLTGKVTNQRVGSLSLWCTLGVALLVGNNALGHFSGSGFLGGGLLLDTVGTPFVFLTVTLLPVVVLASLDSIRKNQKMYYFWVLFLGGVLVLCFCVEDFLVFYVLFEILGFPMFVLIGQYGPRTQRVSAAYKFFVYTFGGAAFILPVLVYLHWGLGCTGVITLREYQFTEYEQALFFGLCVIPFGVKIPVVPVHLWLPEAHVEAPTPISMLLAGLLLKTGGYAFLRFLLPIWPHGGYLWGPFLSGVGIFSVIVASLYALVQVDLKRMIAYASVAHMSVCLLGLLSGTPQGSQGATYLMLAHGYTSAGLFAGVGVLYDRYHTRTIRYYGGLSGVAPILAGSFFILSLSNLGFPFTGGFTGEFMILASLGETSFLLCLLAGSTIFLSLGYSMWLFNRLFYGKVQTLVKHNELTPIEFGVLGYCTIFSLGLGFGGSLFVGKTQECYAQLFCTSSLV